MSGACTEIGIVKGVGGGGGGAGVEAEVNVAKLKKIFVKKLTIYT